MVQAIRRGMTVSLMVWAMVMCASGTWAAPAGEDKAADQQLSEGKPDSRPLMALNLSAEQLKKLSQEKSARQKNMIKLRADMETLMVDLETAVGSDQPDQGKIEELTRKVGDLHGQILLGRLKSVLYLRSILTPEQKQKFDASHFGFGIGLGGRGHGRGDRGHQDWKENKRQ